MEATNPGWRERYGRIFASVIFMLLGGVEGVWMAQRTFQNGLGLWRAYVAVIPIALFVGAIQLAVNQRGRRRVLYFLAATAAQVVIVLTLNLR